MDTSNSDDDTIHYDNDGNIIPDPAVQTNMADYPATTRALNTAELVHHIIRYLPVSSYRSCSMVNHFLRNAIRSTSLNFQTFDAATKENFESTSKRIYILNSFVLQYSPTVDLGLPTGSSSHQFMFSCQARAGSADSYGSGSNSDGKSGGGESSGHTGTSGESSGMSHLQRHHTHQPGHDLEPFHSFHTYQSSAIVPNVYFKTGLQLPPHLSSPPPLPPFPSPAQQPSTQQQRQQQRQSPSQQYQQHQQQQHTRTTGFLPGQSSNSDLHSYEADISTDSYASSIMVDVAEMSLSPGEYPPDGLSTFPSELQQQQQQQPPSATTTPPLPSSSWSSTATITSGMPIPSSWQQQQQQQQQQHPTLRVVPCPYDLPNEAASAMQYRKGSRTSTGSGHSGDSSSGNSGNGVGEILQASYLPYTSPIMEESSNPSARAYVGRYDTHSLSAAGQGSSRFRSDRERAPDYQRSIQEQQQYGLQAGGSRDIPMTDQSMYTSSSSSYGPSSAHTPQQQHHHHSRRHHHHTESDSAHISTSGSSADTSHHRHEQQQQHHTSARPKRNWSMAVETFYYQRAALNAMIVACREHMESHAGQGGHIVERTETTRIIWNETTRQEHIWTITPSLMDRSNPGDFIEPDYDPHSSEHDSAW